MTERHNKKRAVVMFACLGAKRETRDGPRSSRSPCVWALLSEGLHQDTVRQL